MNSHHDRLFAIAYRMLGSIHDAEDAVQETYIRWQKLTDSQRDEIRSPAAWLTTVIGRICLDLLGSARVRREQYVGVWLPEPILDQAESSIDPANAVALAESITMAMLVVMEQLSPAERVAFILHDLFAVPFNDIAGIVGRSPTAVRQLATSARRHLHSTKRYACDGHDRDRVVEAFISAATSGDLQGLVKVLDSAVVLRSDGGGVVSAAIRPVVGPDHVARFVLGVLAGPLAPSWAARYGNGPITVGTSLVNGQNGLIVRLGDELVAVAALGVIDGKIGTIDLVVNPHKLTVDL